MVHKKNKFVSCNHFLINEKHLLLKTGRPTFASKISHCVKRDLLRNVAWTLNSMRFSRNNDKLCFYDFYLKQPNMPYATKKQHFNKKLHPLLHLLQKNKICLGKSGGGRSKETTASFQPPVCSDPNFKSEQQIQTMKVPPGNTRDMMLRPAS